MRTEKEVILNISRLTVSQNLFPEPEGFIMKIFMSCSRVDTKVFKVHSNFVEINQKLSIRNILAKELEFWLCTTNNKIIAVGLLPLSDEEPAEYNIDLKMINTEFGSLQTAIEIRSTEIEKEEYIEPDEELLKKDEDPKEIKRRQEEEVRKAKQAADLLQAAKADKKPPVTLTQFKKKDEPFI